MLVVVAHGESPERLCAALAGTLAARATVQVNPMPWGSLLLADAPYMRNDRWLVAGRPQKDPWGLPLGDLALEEAVAEYEQYGARAGCFGSGPFIVADLTTGHLLRAPNGIVPAWDGMGAGGPVQATSARALRLLSRQVKEISPGAIAGPPGAVSLAATGPGEHLRSLTWEWLDEEIAAHTSRLGPLTPARLHSAADVLTESDRWLWSTATSDVVFVPPLRLASGRAAAMSSTIAARLWSRARLGGRWLFAPLLERPARDTVALVEPGH
jgi:hypothetical protein